MKLRHALDRFYRTTALCDLRLTNHNELKPLSYNTRLYLELIFTLGPNCTASMLAKELGISKAAVTIKLNRLLEDQLISKEPDPQDGRRHRLKVNEAQVPQYQIFRKQDEEAVRRLKSRFSSQQLKDFCQMLDVLSDINEEVTSR